MKRFLVVLLSLGLIIAFGTSVFAADAKFAGQWYTKGWYNKNAALLDKDGGVAPDSTLGSRGSTGFYSTRLRMNINFPIAKGLDFYTRFDALERKWMGPRSTPVYAGSYYANSTKEMENIGWEGAYVRFATPIGMFTVGDVVNSGPFGTIMSDYQAGEGPSGMTIGWGIPIGPLYVGLSTKKGNDNSSGLVGQGMNNDSDTYYLTLIYGWQTGSAGFLHSNVRSETSNVGSGTAPSHGIMPCYTIYVKNKFGIIYFEMETGLATGYARQYTNNKPTETATVGYDIKADMAYSTYWNVEVDLAPIKVGGRFWYSKGDDPATKDTMEGGFRQLLDLDGGVEFCMILWNRSYIEYMGKIAGATTATQGTQQYYASVGAGNAVQNYHMQNIWFYQVYGSYAVTPKLKIDAAYAYAYSDTKPTNNGGPVSATNKEFVGNTYGSELDVMATYKIFDNLSYMVGAAYLWTGDYFKGTNPDAKVVNNYLITHKLMLTF